MQFGEEGKNFYALQQWVNVRLELSNVKHLYVQSIGGPLGVPVGEFDNQFSCNDGSFIDPTNYDVITKVIPCHFAPQSTYTVLILFNFQLAKFYIQSKNYYL